MADVTLAGYKIKKLDVVNNIQKRKRIQIKNTFGFSCRYSMDGRTAVAVLTESVESDGGQDEFHINLELEGVFSVDGTEDVEERKETHIKCYDSLFPFASQIVSQVGSNTGIGNLLLKKIPMDKDSVAFEKWQEKPSADKCEEGNIIDFPSDNE